MLIAQIGKDGGYFAWIIFCGCLGMSCLISSQVSQEAQVLFQTHNGLVSQGLKYYGLMKVVVSALAYMYNI